MKDAPTVENSIGRNGLAPDIENCVANFGEAVWLYFNGQKAYNALVLAPLPPAYFSGGDSSRCRVTKNAASDAFKYCEDLTSWKTRDKKGNTVHRIIASCDAGRYEWNTVMGPLRNPEPKGSLWLVQPDIAGAPVDPLVLENWKPTRDFHPVGVDIFPGDVGEPSTLFVVNHMRDSRVTIEVFALHDESPPRLVHLKELYHPMFWAANSVAALSHNEFFVSIDHWFKRDGLIPWKWFAPQLESFLALPIGLVEYVKFGRNGIDYSVSVLGMPFPNGLALSPDKSKLAVSSTSTNKVRIYDVVPKEGPPIQATLYPPFEARKIKYQTAIPVPFSPDNLHYHEDGSLLVTGHPHFPSINQLAKKKQSTSPSWVVAISERSPNATNDNAPYSAYNRVGLHKDYTMRTVYQSDGTGWSASTSAVWAGKNKDKLVMSGLYTEGVLVC